MGKPKLLSMARVAKRCNSNAGVLTKQARAGVWGELQLIERKTAKSEKRIYIPYGQAQVLIAFHKSYAPLETVANKIRQDKKAVKRVLQGINNLPERHPALAHIGGKIGVKKVGSFHYVELEHAYRIKNALTEFISLPEANRQAGFGQGTLPTLLKKGFWPEAGFVSFGTREQWVHKSVVKKARAFVRNHYTLSQAASLAKMSPSGFHRWIDNWGYPGVKLPAKLNGSSIYVPKNGFRELVRAFKQGKYAAQKTAEPYQPIKQYGWQQALKQFDLKESETAVDAAKLLNQCGTRKQQMAVEDNLKKLSQAKDVNTTTNVKTAYIRLLLEGGGAGSPLARGINALMQTHLEPGKMTTWTGSLSEEEELAHERQFKRRTKYELEEEASMGGDADEMLHRMQNAQAALYTLLQTNPINRFNVLKGIMGVKEKPATQSKPVKAPTKPQKAK